LQALEMQHRCETCLREFSDDSGPLPRRSYVHCVFCGAAIPLPRAQARVSVPPFSSDVQREADFALGVLGAVGTGFPDTLRQFRVKQPPLPPLPGGPSRDGDSLAPLAGDGAGEEAERVVVPVWRGISFWASLGIGFAVGALLAYGAALARRTPETQAVVASTRAASAGPSAKPAALAVATSPAPLTSAAVAIASASAMGSASAVASSRPAWLKADPMAERRFMLERARAEQRRYRLSAAERLYRQVLAHAPQDSEALAGLGELELLRGTTDLARERFDQALQANGNYVPARIAVADLEWQAGHVEAARQAYREIVDLFGADLYPPYVAQRSAVGEPPQCDE
jgi:hypothetical protein